MGKRTNLLTKTLRKRYQGLRFLKYLSLALVESDGYIAHAFDGTLANMNLGNILLYIVTVLLALGLLANYLQTVAFYFFFLVGAL